MKDLDPLGLAHNGKNCSLTWRSLGRRATAEAYEYSGYGESTGQPTEARAGVEVATIEIALNAMVC